MITKLASPIEAVQPHLRHWPSSHRPPRTAITIAILEEPFSTYPRASVPAASTMLAGRALVVSDGVSFTA
jgi:hypothetical protein